MNEIIRVKKTLFFIGKYNVTTQTGGRIVSVCDYEKSNLKIHSVISTFYYENRVPTIEHLNIILSSLSGISVEKIVGRSRKREISIVRQLAMSYLYRNRKNRAYKLSARKIGVIYSGRDHATVFNACSVVKDLFERDKQMTDLINLFLKELKKNNFITDFLVEEKEELKTTN